MFKHILAATDLVGVEDPVVTGAAAVAQTHQAKLDILHVAESSHQNSRHLVKDYKTNEEINFSPEYQAVVQKELFDFYKAILPANMDFDVRVVCGFPWEEIVRHSRNLNAGMIVVGPHSERAAERGTVRVAGKIGSTVEGVVTRENCPVMIINPGVRLSSAAFKKIVVGVDFSVSCECALAFARNTAEKFGSTIFPFHMIPVPPYPKYTKEDSDADRKNTEKRLEEFCRDIVKDSPCAYQLWGGALPHLELVKCAEKNSADLIILGSHTKEKARKWYAGSAVERTAFRAGCPVIVVTDPESLVSWDGNAPNDPAIGKDKDRSIHVFTGQRHVTGNR
ncbi:universal stress protein [uncultured Desulfobacter sp.]|uniref:universal stress protein n=1 Tax=uncultured Desulfobacter sp. TaxID=240139 RepID=UPI002AAB6A59|nr:universal stress protein [uncultured Desulfobacter sp.]